MSALLAGVDLAVEESVRWGEKPALSTPGVYLVSTSGGPDEETGLSSCPVDRMAVRALLAARPKASVDGQQATEASFVERLSELWVPGEPVLYIGLAGTSVRKRVAQYYRTKIGAQAPHAGGWPIKMLSNLDQLWVHVASCSDPRGAELAMLQSFGEALGPDQAVDLVDPDVPVPYANLELTKAVRKRHGFTGVKGPRREDADVSGGDFTPELFDRVKHAVAPGEVISTIAREQPNRIAAVDAEGVYVETARSVEKRTGPQLVPAWMITSAWEHLRRHRRLSQKELLEDLSVKRSAFVCALLSRFEGVEIDSTRPTVLTHGRRAAASPRAGK